MIMKAFTRFKTRVWSTDLPYVGKLDKDYNGVKYLLIRQDLFDRTVDAKGMKTEVSEETVCAILTMITRRIDPKV